MIRVRFFLILKLQIIFWFAKINQVFIYSNTSKVIPDTAGAVNAAGFFYSLVFPGKGNKRLSGKPELCSLNDNNIKRCKEVIGMHAA